VLSKFYFHSQEKIENIKRYSGAVNRRRAENAMAKRKKDKMTNNNLTKNRARQTSLK
jgi:hypothetical protein